MIADDYEAIASRVKELAMPSYGLLQDSITVHIDPKTIERCMERFNNTGSYFGLPKIPDEAKL